MIRHLAGFLVLVLVGLPLLVAPSWLIGALGVAAGALCAGGIIAFSIPVLAAGAALNLIQYALALWLSAGPSDFFVAVTFGVALSLLLEVVEFAARFRGMAVDSRVVRTQVQYWIGKGAVAAVAGVLLAIGAGGVILALPGPLYPAVAALGALAAFTGLLRLVMRNPERSSSEQQR